jgi:hypothetical protein
MMLAIESMFRFAHHDKGSLYLTATQGFIPIRFECISVR